VSLLANAAGWGLGLLGMRLLVVIFTFHFILRKFATWAEITCDALSLCDEVIKTTRDVFLVTMSEITPLKDKRK
jgi:hypothetical protein